MVGCLRPQSPHPVAPPPTRPYLIFFKRFHQYWGRVLKADGWMGAVLLQTPTRAHSEVHAGSYRTLVSIRSPGLRQCGRSSLSVLRRWEVWLECFSAGPAQVLQATSLEERNTFSCLFQNFVRPASRMALWVKVLASKEKTNK